MCQARQLKNTAKVFEVMFLCWKLCSAFADAKQEKCTSSQAGKKWGKFEVLALMRTGKPVDGLRRPQLTATASRRHMSYNLMTHDS